MRRTLLFLMILALAVGTSAQDSPYRLVTPSAEVYITFIIDHEEQLTPDVKRVLLAEINTRYEHMLYRVDYNRLHAAADILEYRTSTNFSYSVWETEQIVSWINANEIDLAETETLAFDAYNIRVTAVDFNGDGDDEYILDTVRGCHAETVAVCYDNGWIRQQADYAEYIVVEQIDTATYRFVPSPLPWQEEGHGSASPQSGYLHSWDISDLNHDGLPEWRVHFFNSWQYSFVSQTYILGWRDGALVDLAESPVRYACDSTSSDCTNEYEWIDLDGDGILEIEIRYPARDNWFCNQMVINRYVWNGSVYAITRVEGDFDESANCHIRQAETAMYARDYETARQHYAQAFIFDEPPYNRSYIQFRYAIAEAWTGDIDAAVTRLRTVQANASNPIPELIDAVLDAYDTYGTFEWMCLAAYRFIATNPQYLDTHIYIVGGRVVNSGYLQTPIQPASPPDLAGCDVEAFITADLENTDFITSTSPIQQLEVLNWPVERSFHADFNNDGVDEWLVWIEEQQLHPILFVSAGDHYDVLRFAEPFYDRYSRGNVYLVDTIVLPENAGTALVTLQYVVVDRRVYEFEEGVVGRAEPYCPEQQVDPVVYLPANLEIWRLGDNGFESIFDVYICEEGDIADFVTTNMIRGWTRDNTDWLTEQMYIWNASVQTYVAPPLPTPNPTHTATPNDETDVIPIDRILSSDYYDYLRADYQAVIEETDVLLDRRDELQLDELYSTLYIRALSLEALGRTDEALVTYVAIYEAAPDHIWGILAGLHFTPAEG